MRGPCTGTGAVGLLNVFVFSWSTLLYLFLLIAIRWNTNTKEDGLNLWMCSNASIWEMACWGADAHIRSRDPLFLPGCCCQTSVSESFGSRDADQIFHQHYTHHENTRKKTGDLTQRAQLCTLATFSGRLWVNSCQLKWAIIPMGNDLSILTFTLLWTKMGAF